ncbi:MAG: hypothetical protein R3220_09600 [Balneolaceae bacterium]|nr:hypothetical protein [Balneolaceae bacterium]
MKNQLNLLLSTLTLLILFSFAACSDDNSTGSNGETPESHATINGTVQDEFSKSTANSMAKVPDNTVVTAATISSSGSLEMKEETETEVEASGDFSLDVDASTAEEIVVVAEGNGSKLKGFISAEVENENSYTIKPLDVESSAETDVYTEIKADGNTNIVHKSDIETVVTANSAADVYGNSSATGEVVAAVTNSAQARADFFAEFTESAEANIDSYFEAMTDAQFEYEAALNSSTSNDQAEAAFEAFLETKVNAYSDAGLEAKENAEFLHLQGKAILNSMGSVSAEVENEARHNSSFMLAIATDNAVRTRAEASGMSQSTIDAIADAGVTLRADVRGSNGSESSVEAAFETYHDEVRGAIESDSSVEGAAVVTIDTEINVASGAKATLSSTLSGLVDASQMIDAYIQFDSEVDAIVDTNSGLIGDIDAEILSDIMVLINLSS